MARGQSSFDLLAHFDRPKSVGLPDFEWVDDVLSNERPAGLIDYFAPSSCSEEPLTLPRSTQRGIRWVLQWAAALAVFAFAASVLTEFAYLVAAEHRLALAARAGVTEATFPRATYESATAAARRRLTGYPLLARQLHVALMQNGSLVQRQFSRNEGDHFAITLWAPSSSVVPDWLRAITFWRGDSRIQAHAEQQAPGRKLPFPLAPHTAAE